METLFPILLLESVVNFSGRDVFSNVEFDHSALFHAPRYLLFTHHSSNSQRGLNSSNPSRREGGGCGFTLSRSHTCCAVRLVYIQISPGHIRTTLYYTRMRSKVGQSVTHASRETMFYLLTLPIAQMASHCSGGQSSASHRQGLGSLPGPSM